MSLATRGLTGCLFVAAVVVASQRPASGQGREPQRPQVAGVLKSVDVAAGTITFNVGGGREAPVEQTYPLAKNVEVALASATTRSGLFKEGKLPARCSSFHSATFSGVAQHRALRPDL